MAQAYITDYTRYYRTPPYSKRAPFRPETNRFDGTPPEGGNWLVFQSLGDSSDEVIDHAKKLVYDFQRNRYWTVYQVDYSKEGKFEFADDGSQLGDFKNDLLDSCKRWEMRAKEPIPPPLPSSRRVFGYMRPENFHIPQTVYEKAYGSIACEVLGDEMRKKKEREKQALRMASGELENVAGDGSKAKDLKGKKESEPLKEEDKCKCGELVWQQIADMRNLNLRRTAIEKKKVNRKKGILHLPVNKKKCQCL